MSGESLPLRALAGGSRGRGYSVPVVLVVDDADVWEETWRTLNPDDSSAPPEVDWARDMVVVVALGPRPTTGYAVRIEEIVATATTMDVHCLETRPGSYAAHMMTYPFHAVVVAVAARRETPRLVSRVEVTKDD